MATAKATGGVVVPPARSRVGAMASKYCREMPVVRQGVRVADAILTIGKHQAGDQ